MGVSLAVRALVVAAQRQNVVNPDGATRLRHAADGVELPDPVAVRRWLDGGGVPDDLAAHLFGLLPPAGMPPFGPFAPLAHLAEGGMGRVWLSVDPHGALAVVKTVRPGQTALSGPAGERARRRLQREIAATTGLRHPHIVACLGSGGDDDGMWMALEFLGDGDLEQLVLTRGPLPETVALRFAAQVADALAAAGRAGMVHRDVKPANIFLDGTVAKLADFGVVRMAAGDGAALTMPGALVGSPTYISPEQARAGAVDARSDIYALGCVLHYMLSGHPPYAGTPFQVMRAHAQEPPPPPPEGIGAATRALLARAMAKAPEQRFASAGELHEALVAAGAAARAAGGPDPAAWFGSGAATAPGRSPIRYREPEEVARRRGGSATGRTTRGIARSTDLDVVAAGAEPGTAIEGAWLALLAANDGSGRAVHCYAGHELTIGKMAKPPVLLTALNYPIAQHGEALHRISRSHAVLRCDRAGATLVDLGGTNGTAIDRRPIPPGSSHALPPNRRTAVSLAGVVELELEPLADAPGRPPQAVLIRRPANRPELAYALVPVVLRLGESLPWPGLEGVVELAHQGGGWHWRRPDGEWRPVRAGERLPCGVAAPWALPGDHRLLTG